MHLYGYATIRLMPYLKTDSTSLLPKTEVRVAIFGLETAYKSPWSNAASSYAKNPSFQQRISIYHLWKEFDVMKILQIKLCM